MKAKHSIFQSNQIMVAHNHVLWNTRQCFWKQTPFYRDLEIQVNIWSKRMNLSTHDFQVLLIELPLIMLL